ncbi:unnamed protein product [Caenorhabditis auriculariae]|uniref:Cyclic nucleotide-binding domain-containing protein n=1 Tax=Caenorhabditis auriculariae TaxID=2777116 RepID=A0A8S1HGU7_9PELO|nr:unnamed protein product [Caenorhabditis auriculariae]
MFTNIKLDENPEAGTGSRQNLKTRSRHYLRAANLAQKPAPTAEEPLEPPPKEAQEVPKELIEVPPKSNSHWESVRAKAPQAVAKARFDDFRANPVVLDSNKGEPPPEGRRNAVLMMKSSFGDVVKTAMLVRNWMTAMEHDEHETEPCRSSTTAVFEPDPVTDEAAGLSEDNDLLPENPTGWRIFLDVLEDRIRKIIFFYVSTSSNLQYYWTALVATGVFYNTLAMVIFIFDDVFNGYFGIWLWFNSVFDAIFVIDILVQARTTFLFDGSEVKNTVKMWKNYVESSRIFPDLLALAPLDLLLLINPTISMCRSVRLFKAYRVLDFVETTQKRTVFPHATKIAFLMTACYILFHWNACVYFLFSLFEGLSEDDTSAFGFSYYKVFDPRFPLCTPFHDDDCWYDENTSVLDLDDERPKYMQEMFEYWNVRGFTKFVMGNFSREYSMSIYWSSLTITTCGQQPWPSTSPQNMLEVINTLIGVLVFATIIGSVGNVVTQMNQSVYDFREKMDAIKFYMKYRNVHAAIQERVLSCFMYLNTHNQLNDEKEVLDVLPTRFQGHIAVNLHMETLKRVKLFQTCDAGFLYEVVQLVKQQVYSPNDYLCRKDEKAKEMFIVKKGTLSVIDDDTGVELETLNEGATFGELSIVRVRGNLLGDRRSVSLRSVGYSDVYVLHQDDVTRVLREYQKDRENLIRNARQMLHERGLLETSENGEIDYDDFDVEDETMIELLSVDEQLTRLTGVVRELEVELGHIYDSFTHMAQHWKQRVTSVEETFTYNERRIRRDCIRGIFDTMTVSADIPKLQLENLAGA